LGRATIRNSDPRFDDRPRRLGRAGLDALMDDPRYWDGDHPDHDQVVDTVRRGFEVVFAPPRNPELTTVPINGNIPVTDPNDPRFNPDGSPKPEWYRGDTTRIWNGRNSRYDPETGEFEYYADLPDYHRDPDTGRWTKKDCSQKKQEGEDKPARGQTGNGPPSELIVPAPVPPLGGIPKNKRDFLRWLLWGTESGIWAKDSTDKLERSRERSKSRKDDERR
jgi:hypothetical protein